MLDTAFEFSGCTSLASITLNGTEAGWSAVTKGEGWDANTGKYLLVPAAQN